VDEARPEPQVIDVEFAKPTRNHEPCHNLFVCEMAHGAIQEDSQTVVYDTLEAIMDIPSFSPLDDDNAPFDSKEFDAGYLARLSGEPQSLTATRGWRAGWADADAGLIHKEMPSLGRTA
jgi:hypothetical protein